MNNPRNWKQSSRCIPLESRLQPVLTVPRTAFTLVELLVVIAIMLVLMGLAVPALNSLLASGNLARTGQILGDQINLARQTASAQNSPVEVRLFKLSDDEDEGYGAVQLWTYDPSGTAVPFAKLIPFPSGIAVAQNTTLSKAFAGAPDPLPTATTGSLSNVPYVSVQVRPSGVLAPALNMNDCYMTVVSDRFAGDATLPDNYVIVQINPLTSTPLVYRP